MKRGDIVVVSAAGDYGKPRPAAIIQENLFNETHASILVGLLTTDIQEAPFSGLNIDPSDDNGLKKRSQIMVDKIVAMRRERISSTIGKIDDDTLIRVNRSLALILGLAQ